MFPKKPYDSPASGYGPPTATYGPPTATYGPPTGEFGYEFGARSPPPGSYYAEEAPQLFYRWSSPPGLVRALGAVVILLCVAIFACVASTLAWEYGYGYGYGSGVFGNGPGGFYGSGYYGGGVNYGYGYGGYYGGVTNPRTANGFMMAMAVLCFLAQLGLLVASLSKSSGARSRRFYLAVLVACAVLALVMLVATIVYVVGVNPQAQMSGGGYYYSPLLAMCSQVYAGGAVLNQYLYHYCTVDPQEAVAIACGFLIVLLLCLICLFAHKTRSRIWKFGKHNIQWDRIPAGPEGPDVEEWVKNVSGGTSVPDEAATVAYSEKGETPGPAPPYSPPAYSDDPPSPSEDRDRDRDRDPRPPARRGRRGRRPAEPEESRQSQGSQCSQYDTEATSAPESGEECDGDGQHWHRLFPPLGSPASRRRYKDEFAAGLRRYRELCAQLDAPGQRLAQLEQQLEQLPEDSAQYQALAEEYNRLKDLKRSPEYQEKKRESQTLRNKLFHIKRMVSDYDKLRG
ncbi:LOW QUALITY PROTEIN: occludin [Oenanthe melanoleuca]|uniref:LOW QUALITY PROTEIN: occludin n=1 Tax=Oenanthe melanoleuca TaxID=2939378 RepID=UPI0024C1449D|nr:LOW QUALITY PROTEIN: occludin [Oenanthe melanoleuca]